MAGGALPPAPLVKHYFSTPQADRTKAPPMDEIFEWVQWAIRKLLSNNQLILILVFVVGPIISTIVRGIQQARKRQAEVQSQGDGGVQAETGAPYGRTDETMFGEESQGESREPSVGDAAFPTTNRRVEEPEAAAPVEWRTKRSPLVTKEQRDEASRQEGIFPSSPAMVPPHREPAEIAPVVVRFASRTKVRRDPGIFDDAFSQTEPDSSEDSVSATTALQSTIPDASISATDWRRAIIVQEVLGVPVSMRNFGPGN